MGTTNEEKIAFSFYMHFAFRFIALGALISIIPLIFVNLPLMAAFIRLPSFFYALIMFLINATTLVVCFALASKLIFSWGVKEHAFNITNNKP